MVVARFDEKYTNSRTFDAYVQEFLVLFSYAWHGRRPVHAIHPMAQQLPNYLRTYRRARGLTQADAALILGAASKTVIHAHERSARRPSLETLIAYELILGATLRSLYAGTYRKVERQVARRAKRLAEVEAEKRPTPRREHRLETLRELQRSAAHP